MPGTLLLANKLMLVLSSSKVKALVLNNLTYWVSVFSHGLTLKYGKIIHPFLQPHVSLAFKTTCS